jgi:hypothetical protein
MTNKEQRVRIAQRIGTAFMNANSFKLIPEDSSEQAVIIAARQVRAQLEDALESVDSHIDSIKNAEVL